MEKIIYVNAAGKEQARENAEKNNRKRRFRTPWTAPYTVVRKTGTALGFPVTQYRIYGITEQEAAASEGPVGEGAGERRRSSFHRMLKKIGKQIRKREMQDMTEMSERAFLFCTWREYRYPVELMSAFYQSCYRKDAFVSRAEQLIFLDGWERGEGEEDEWRLSALEAPELALMQEIYTTYNYATIVTERMDFWQEFVETAYEEYGLSVRCVEDDRNIAFREKKTVIVDMGRRAFDCCGRFPADSVYMDLRESHGKTRQICIKCGRIPYLSLRNALDTALKDTV